MDNFAPGTFGHVTESLGMGWSDMARITGLRHTTIYRWAVNSQAGKPILLRADRAVVFHLIDHINRLDVQRGGSGNYTAGSFGFVWIRLDDTDSTVSVVGQRLTEINNRLSGIACPRQQYAAIAEIGRAARSEADRAAWDIAWQRYCRVVFPYAPKAYRQPPRGVDWYLP